MKILFSQEYSGHVFTQKGIMMDTVITNTIGLIICLSYVWDFIMKKFPYMSVWLIIMTP